MAKRFVSLKPKRPASCYIRFAYEMRRGENGDSRMNIVEQSAKYSRMWKDLDESEKKKYLVAYVRDLEIYKRQMEEYKKSEEYRQEMAERAAMRRMRGKTYKPITAYLLFIKEMFEELKGETFKNIIAKAREKWRSISDEKKMKLAAKAQEVNDSRQEEMRNGEGRARKEKGTVRARDVVKKIKDGIVRVKGDIIETNESASKLNGGASTKKERAAKAEKDAEDAKEYVMKAGNDSDETKIVAVKDEETGIENEEDIVKEEEGYDDA